MVRERWTRSLDGHLNIAYGIAVRSFFNQIKEDIQARQMAQGLERLCMRGFCLDRGQREGGFHKPIDSDAAGHESRDLEKAVWIEEGAVQFR